MKDVSLRDDANSVCSDKTSLDHVESSSTLPSISLVDLSGDHCDCTGRCRCRASVVTPSKPVASALSSEQTMAPISEADETTLRPSSTSIQEPPSPSASR